MSGSDMLINFVRHFCNIPVIHSRLIDKSRRDEQRLIYIVDLADGSRMVIKAIQSNGIGPGLVESWAVLAHQVSQTGILTSRFIARLDGRGYAVVSDDWVLWAEEYVVQKDLDTAMIRCEDIPPNHLIMIGDLLGRMLSCARSSPIACYQRGPYSLFTEFDENYANATMLFEALTATAGIDQSLLNSLRQEYLNRWSAISQRLPALPYSMVQGDLSPNNILIDESGKPCGVLDYNLAGEDYLITYAIQELVFLAFETYAVERLDSEHLVYAEQRFGCLLQGLLSTYQSADVERQTIPLIYNIARPFRWDKVIITIRKARSGQVDEVNERLRWMMHELTRDYPHVS